MKKNTLLFVLFCSFATGFAQQKDSILSATITAHIFKPATVDATDALIGDFKKPKGFTVKKFAGDLGRPRMMALGPNGEIYVTSREEGYVMMLKDENQDGIAEVKQKLLIKENAHGITVKNGMLYLITVNDVYKAKINPDGTLGNLEQIVKDLPDGGQHNNRTLAFGPDGMLYISVGSTCNACDETRDENATMVRVDSTGNGRTIYAKGLRNTIGFDWEPTTQTFYGLDHGIDWLGDEIQMEELNVIEENGNYGWPYIYGKSQYNLADEPPTMTYPEYAAQSIEPVMQLKAHAAPLDFKFYKGAMFPAEYKNSALVSLHGSWNREKPSGYKLIWIRYENGKPVAQEDFITGFLTDGNKEIIGRPVGLLELKDGSVLVSDDENGNIYRITYGI